MRSQLLEGKVSPSYAGSLVNHVPQGYDNITFVVKKGFEWPVGQALCNIDVGQIPYFNFGKLYWINHPQHKVPRMLPAGFQKDGTIAWMKLTKNVQMASNGELTSTKHTKGGTPGQTPGTPGQTAGSKKGGFHGHNKATCYCIVCFQWRASNDCPHPPPKEDMSKAILCKFYPHVTGEQQDAKLAAAKLAAAKLAADKLAAAELAAAKLAVPEHDAADDLTVSAEELAAAAAAVDDEEAAKLAAAKIAAAKIAAAKHAAAKLAAAELAAAAAATDDVDEEAAKIAAAQHAATKPAAAAADDEAAAVKLAAAKIAAAKHPAAKRAAAELAAASLANKQGRPSRSPGKCGPTCRCPRCDPHGEGCECGRATCQPKEKVTNRNVQAPKHSQYEQRTDVNDTLQFLLNGRSGSDSASSSVHSDGSSNFNSFAAYLAHQSQQNTYVSSLEWQQLTLIAALRLEPTQTSIRISLRMDCFLAFTGALVSILTLTLLTQCRVENGTLLSFRTQSVALRMEPSCTTSDTAALVAAILTNLRLSHEVVDTKRIGKQRRMDKKQAKRVILVLVTVFVCFSLPPS
eukprot:g81606.t1